MKFLHDRGGGVPIDQFDSSDNLAFAVQDLTLLVRDFANTLFQIGIFGKLANGIAFFVQNVPFFVDLFPI